jgi:hypothetical protein
MSKYFHPILTGLLIIISMNLTAQENNADKTVPAGIPVKQIKILTVGNSFSANATRYLDDIAKASGNCELVLAHAEIGGCSLERHWNIACKNDADPKDPEGRPYKFNGRKAGLKEILMSDKWQFVTIQQVSPLSFKIDSYRPYAKNLYDYIKKYAPEAEVVIHQTWAYRSDDKGTYNAGLNSVKMYQQLTEAYYTIAKELGCRVIPSGTAFHLVGETPGREFKPDSNFDYRNPKYPDLPKETHSLHNGYGWSTEGEVKKLGFDTHHANSAGKYLAGCVWFEFFFREDVKKIKFKPQHITDDDAAFFRDIAHKVVSEGLKPKASE